MEFNGVVFKMVQFDVASVVEEAMRWVVGVVSSSQFGSTIDEGGSV